MYSPIGKIHALQIQAAGRQEKRRGHESTSPLHHENQKELRVSKNFGRYSVQVVSTLFSSTIKYFIQRPWLELEQCHFESCCGHAGPREQK